MNYRRQRRMSFAINYALLALYDLARQQQDQGHTVKIKHKEQ